MQSPRVTIIDIARRAGVSKGAVSYALNGRPGVSEGTRERILSVADELGWVPNRTARLLSGSRTDAYGLVLSRDPAILATEPFYMQLIAGIESTLSAHSSALLLQMTPNLDAEMATYRLWASERRVDAVVAVDPRVDDPRIPLFAELGLPAIFMATKDLAADVPAVRIDDRVAMRSAVEYLAGLGHERIARVSGLGELLHVTVRDDAFQQIMITLGLAPVIIECDFTAQSSRQATSTLINSAEPPTAIIYDNDVMAVAGLAVMMAEGVSVPSEVSVLAWDDSPLCELTHPQLTALSHDVMALGSHVVRRLDALLGGTDDGELLQDYTPRLRVRGSTAPPTR